MVCFQQTPKSDIKSTGKERSSHLWYLLQNSTNTKHFKISKNHNSVISKPHFIIIIITGKHPII